MNLRQRVVDFFREWAARRAGRKHVPTHVGRAAQDASHVAGGIGAGGITDRSGTYDRVAEAGNRYEQSFEKHRKQPVAPKQVAEEGSEG